MREYRSSEFPNARIDPEARICGEDVVVGDGAIVEAGVRIEARRVRIGLGATIERATTARGLGGEAELFDLGDQSFIGFENQILCPSFSMGDYAQLHNRGLHSGYAALTIGHNSWIGQNSILNCTERLTLGNNVRIGTGSQLWTHVASGETLEGCTLFGNNPLTLEDNVWIVGGAVISPGLLLERNAIIMTGSVLTRSAEPYHTYAGVPARDVTDKLQFWKPVTLADKMAMMRQYVSEFANASPGLAKHVHVIDESDSLARFKRGDVVVAPAVNAWEDAQAVGISLLDLTTKQYLKQCSEVEVALLRFLVGYRARFIPRSA